MAETKAKPGMDKVWTKKKHSTWHQKWVPDLVPRSGYQIWRPEVGTRFGAKKWVPNLALNMEYNLEQRGDQKWVPDLVPRSGYQIWCPEVGTRFITKPKLSIVRDRIQAHIVGGRIDVSGQPLHISLEPKLHQALPLKKPWPP